MVHMTGSYILYENTERNEPFLNSYLRKLARLNCIDIEYI